jgi:hypothetical protein
MARSFTKISIDLKCREKIKQDNRPFSWPVSLLAPQSSFLGKDEMMQKEKRPDSGSGLSPPYF